MNIVLDFSLHDTPLGLSPFWLPRRSEEELQKLSPSEKMDMGRGKVDFLSTEDLLSLLHAQNLVQQRINSIASDCSLDGTLVLGGGHHTHIVLSYIPAASGESAVECFRIPKDKFKTANILLLFAEWAKRYSSSL